MAVIFTNSLKGKLISLCLTVSLVPIAIIGYFSYSSGRVGLKESIFKNMLSVVQSREMHILTLLELRMQQIEILAANEVVQTLMENRNRMNEGESLDTEVLKREADNFIKIELPEFSTVTSFFEYTFVGKNGKVYFSTNESAVGSNMSKDGRFLRGLKEKFITDVDMDQPTGKKFFGVVVPIYRHEADHQNAIGVLIAKNEEVVLSTITTDRAGMGKTGEVYIVNEKGFMITESRFIDDAVLRQSVQSEPVRFFRGQKRTMKGVYQNYRGVSVIGASMGDEINEKFGLGWTILAEIETAEAFTPVKELGFRIIWIAIPIALAVIIIAYFVSIRTAGPINEIVNILASTSRELVASVTQIAAGSSETATAVSETTTTTEEVKQTAQVSSQKAGYVSEVALKAAHVSQDGLKSAEESIKGMNHIKDQMESIADSVVRLSEQSQCIGEIIATVNDLAEQSNLLAVNASIEAAKAGEHGRGFAVVAQEVKNLAAQSKQATTQVQSILSDIQKATSSAVMITEQGSKAVEEGVVQATRAGESIKMLAETVTEASRSASQIAASSKEQLVGMDQVVSAMENIREASGQNVDSTRQLETAAQSLQDMGVRLKELVGKYKDD